MRLTMKQKLEMIEEHEINGLSISHVCEKYKYDKGGFKYLLALYRKTGKEFFVDREIKKYQRDTKLLAIDRVLEGETIRQVSLDLEIIDPSIVRDWVNKYKKDGRDAIKDSYSRANYLSKDERAKAIVDKTLLEENERLKAEIAYLKKSQSLTLNLSNITSKEKAGIVTELRKDFDLQVLLEICNLSSSTYYYHFNEKKKSTRYDVIETEIDRLYLKKHKKRMGYKRIHQDLKKLGYKISKKKVLEIMRAKGYTKKRKRRRYVSYAGEVGRIADNLMNQDFSTTGPYEKAGTDVTMFSFKGYRVYLSPIIDFHTREVLAYAVGTDAKMDKIKTMMEMLEQKHGDYVPGMMIQSDQGVQYQNSRYREMLDNLDIIQSMSRKGNCLDNSPTENFFGRMKEEMWYGFESDYDSALELIDAIVEYIDYYNNVRLVFKYGMTPIEHRNSCLNEFEQVGV